jgi:hypothetical protein
MMENLPQQNCTALQTEKKTTTNKRKTKQNKKKKESLHTELLTTGRFSVEVLLFFVFFLAGCKI